jgi:hypothetical protein
MLIRYDGMTKELRLLHNIVSTKDTFDTALRQWKTGTPGPYGTPANLFKELDEADVDYMMALREAKIYLSLYKM